MNHFWSFDERDIVPVAYTACALALWVLFRRTLPSMAISAVAFIAVRLTVFWWVRQNPSAPLQPTVPNTTIALNGTSTGTLNPRAWIVSNQTINAVGHVIGQNGIVGHGTSVGNGPHGIVID